MNNSVCYIVNYNAKDDLIGCLKSIIHVKDEIENLSICVVDNASTDGSVDFVRNIFGNKVELIENKENVGGSGGFNVALEDAVKRGIDKAILLDNDIHAEKSCINNMINYLDLHKDVGAVGAKIMIMDRPNIIQEFGSHLDMQHFNFKTDYWHEEDNGTEKEIESEYLSSCALAVRMEAVKKTNLFPAENFLFWDDLQFTWEIAKAGYRLVSLSDAKVWHKGNRKAITNTSRAYYGMRNRVKFFSICVSEDRLNEYCESILGECFDIIFGSGLKGLDKMNSARMIALDDFVHKKYGKISDKAYWEIKGSVDKIADLSVEDKTVYIREQDCDMDDINAVVSNLKDRLDRLGVAGYSEDEDSADIVFAPCKHITKVRNNILPAIWFDSFLNVIVSDDDYNRVLAMPYMKQMFVDLHYDWLMQGIIEERKRYYGSE